MTPFLPPPEWSLSVVSHGHVDGVRRLLCEFGRLLDPQRHELLLTLNLGENIDGLEALWPGRITRIANAQPRGFAANHNAALLHARGRYVAALDPELQLSSDPFPALADALSRPEVGIAATVVLDEHGEPTDHARRLPTPGAILRRKLRGESGSYARTLENELAVDWIAGMFMAARADTWRRLRGFDERFYLYCEDVDLCLRAWNAGLQVRVIPGAPVTHVAQRQTLKKMQHFLWHGQSFLRLWRAPAYREFRVQRSRR